MGLHSDPKAPLPYFVPTHQVDRENNHIIQKGITHAYVSLLLFTPGDSTTYFPENHIGDTLATVSQILQTFGRKGAELPTMFG